MNVVEMEMTKKIFKKGYLHIGVNRVQLPDSLLNCRQTLVYFRLVVIGLGLKK